MLSEINQSVKVTSINVPKRVILRNVFMNQQDMESSRKLVYKPAQTDKECLTKPNLDGWQRWLGLCGSIALLYFSE